MSAKIEREIVDMAWEALASAMNLLERCGENLQLGLNQAWSTNSQCKIQWNEPAEKWETINVKSEDL